MQALSAIFAYVVLFLVPVIGASLLACNWWLVRRVASGTRRKVRRALALLGGTATLLGAAGMAATIAAGLATYAERQLDTADVLACTVAGVFSALFFVCGQAVFRVRRAVGSESIIPSERVLDERTVVLRGIAWLFILLPLVYFGPLLVVGLIIPVCLLAVVLLGLTVKRRGHEAHLLWVLTIAVENRLPVAEELFAHAATLRGRRRLQTEQLASRLRSGIPLWQALDELGHLVPRSLAMSARVSEPLGTLPATLREAASRQTKAIQQSAEVTSVAWFLLHYTVVLSVVALLMAFQRYLVVPRFLMIFESFDADFPGYSAGTIDTINSVIENAALLMPIAAVPVAVLAVLGMGHYRGWENLNLPVVSRLFPRADTPWLLRNLSRAFSARQNLPDGLQPIAAHHHRFDVGRRLSRVLQKATQGDDCWAALRTERFINAQEEILLSTAQRAGNLPWALGGLADEIERRQGYRLRAAFEFIRPVLVFAIGSLVAGVCLAWFLPLVELIQGHTFSQ